MGESYQFRDVVLSNTFYLAETPVTRGQWHAVMGTTPWDDDDPEPGNWDHPATHVSYYDALEYCHSETATGKRRYRLPTEAEWEYACRAGTETAYSFRDEAGSLGEYAWYRSNSNGQTQPVATKAANLLGLHDMHGLVTEWCADDWHWAASGDLIDPLIRNGDQRKVVRGGSWASASDMCESSRRYGVHGRWRTPHIGFRLVIDAQQRNRRTRPKIRVGATQQSPDSLANVTV